MPNQKKAKFFARLFYFLKVSHGSLRIISKEKKYFLVFKAFNLLYFVECVVIDGALAFAVEGQGRKIPRKIHP